VASNTKQAIKKINEVSRQLLSRMLEMESEAQAGIHADPLVNDEEIEKKSRQTSDLTSQRQHLIELLFQQKTIQEIQAEHILINEMAALDSQLADKSQAFKNSLAEQVIKLKKSKKISNSYQKL